MVVDDSSTGRTVIRKELRAAGYKILTFSDGLEALSSLRWMRKLPEMLILDIDMPLGWTGSPVASNCGPWRSGGPGLVRG